MQDSKPDKPSESKTNELTYKIIVGFTNTVPDANEINSDPVHSEIIRVTTELVERLRADHPDRGVVMDVTEVAVCSEAYII